MDKLNSLPVGVCHPPAVPKQVWHADELPVRAHKIIKLAARVCATQATHLALVAFIHQDKETVLTIEED